MTLTVRPVRFVTSANNGDRLVTSTSIGRRVVLSVMDYNIGARSAKTPTNELDELLSLTCTGRNPEHTSQLGAIRAISINVRGGQRMPPKLKRRYKPIAKPTERRLLPPLVPVVTPTL